MLVLRIRLPQISLFVGRTRRFPLLPNLKVYQSRAEITDPTRLVHSAPIPRIFKQMLYRKAFLNLDISTYPCVHVYLSTRHAGQCGDAKGILPIHPERTLRCLFLLLAYASHLPTLLPVVMPRLDSAVQNVGAPRMIGPLLSGAGSPCLLGLGLGTWSSDLIRAHAVGVMRRYYSDAAGLVVISSAATLKISVIYYERIPLPKL